MTENTNDIRRGKSLFCIYTSLELEKKQMLDFLKNYFNKNVFIKEQMFFAVFSKDDIGKTSIIPYEKLEFSFLGKMSIFNEIKLELRNDPIIVFDSETVNDETVEEVRRKLKVIIPLFNYDSEISDYDNIIKLIKYCYGEFEDLLLKLNSDFEYILANNNYISFEQFTVAIKEGRIEII